MELRRRNYKIIIGVITLVLIVIFSFLYTFNKGLFYNNETLREELRSQNQNSDFVAKLLGAKQIVVHYPMTDNDVLNNKFKKEAIDVLNNINKENYNNKYINIDYKINEYNDYISFGYDDMELYNKYQTDDNNIELKEKFDAYLIKLISNEIIYNIKLNYSLIDRTSNLEFYNKVWNDEIEYKTHIYKDELIVCLDKEYNYIRFSIDLEEISNHIDLELGIKQTLNDTYRIRKRYVNPNKPKVAFTFDDGPYSIVTNRLIEEMIKLDAVGTFYMLGNRVFDESQHDTINNIILYGNEIGNHSVSHPNLVWLSDKKLDHELHAVDNYMIEHFQYEIKTFRPPYGSFNNRIDDIVEDEIILWDVDSLDWKYRDTDPTYNEIMNNVRDGSIILLHDLYDTSVDAALLAMKELLKQGYQFVTVSELLH